MFPFANNTFCCSYKLWGFKFRSIAFGRVPPRVTGVKVYRTPASRDEIVIDVDVEYFGDADIAIALMRVAASVADVQVVLSLNGSDCSIRMNSQLTFF